MNKELTEVIELPDSQIIIHHHTGALNMFFSLVLRPFIQPIGEIGFEFKYKIVTGFVYGAIAYFSGLFDPSVVEGLFKVPIGLVEGLCILVVLDFIAGTLRAMFDERIKFHPAKWMKTFHKIVSYSLGIVAITIGANMFPDALGWLQYLAFLVVTGHEIWSVAKHVKFTAYLLVAIEIYKNRDSLFDIDYDELKRKVDERSAFEFARSQSNFFGNEQVEIKPKNNTAHEI